MTSTLNPYISFSDTAREALDFYQSVFGGDIVRSTFGDMNPNEDPADADKIMHSQLTTPSGFTLMASDTPATMQYTPGNNISVSLSGFAPDSAELTGFWHALTEGATITAPLNVAPWGDTFGMLIDRFGINWLVNISAAPAAPAAPAAA
ncbi:MULTISPECIES: VOC family protein [Subtercola]|uniref:VOC family protein n=1 Tax=Subtercola vilae TaxID=2056433 RepID=A0A4T2BLA2_9MICO|nr:MULTISPECIES: VOC family protein [Subtercola]MEA9985865.1 VOC family protein [Subtercola sp. RTI3]TIH32285.1 VOC family protein [Subtercola vilae]